MLNLSDQELFELLTALIVLIGACYALIGLLRVMKRSRPEFNVGTAIGVAFCLRILAAVGLGQLAIARDLRGGDELTFLSHAEAASSLPISGSESTDYLTSELHTFLFSLHYRLFDLAPPDLMLRGEMVLFSTVAVLLLAAAVYELAGPRPARLAAWLLALEPASIFFSSLLHKEPLMYLAEGLVVYGGALLWKRGKLIAILPMVVGCLIAAATRPYVGWFLIAAAAAVILHASLTRQRGLQSIALTATCVVAIGVFIPFALSESSNEKLEEFQQSQDANASDGANLSLEQVDYSTRSTLIFNLPRRMSDVILRPYLWQTANASQQLGAIGTLVVLACLALLAVAIARNRKAIMPLAGPFIYPAAFMLVAYSISAGNAGTAYRYRTHLVALAVCLVIVLLSQRKQEQEAVSRMPARPSLGPVNRTRTAT